ncbi:MAG TPA: metalloregulator ArsR/SmtB family transcription factor [Sumerlaeia bacterium]|nr:metalloregulator ArsR/SmtB family transcription factor [Sumerlaeia bacterium]
MDEVRRRRLEARADVIKAMAHPTRLFIVEELACGERCVSELTELIGSDMSTISRHLQVLVHAGILGSERRGNHLLYSLRTPCVLNFFSCVEEVLGIADESQERATCSVCGGGGTPKPETSEA